MAGIAFQGIDKRFGEVRVTEELDLEIHDQEFMVFVGSSGYGDSTALRMIAGLNEPPSNLDAELRVQMSA